MIYMPSNHASVWKRVEQGYPMGWCMSPKGWRRPVRDGASPLPYALDNGMYHPPGERWLGMKGLPPFYRMLDRAAEYHRPEFVVVPDRPYDAEQTRALFPKHARHVADHLPGVRRALALQDGMEAADVERLQPDALFVAGSTDWKWSTAAAWCELGRRLGLWVHIARVNTIRRTRQCVDMGADSADGTGIFRGNRKQLGGVLDALVEGHLWIGKERP